MQPSKQQRIEKEKLFVQGLKQCPHCTEPKSISEFGKHKQTKDGFRSRCKEHEKEERDKPENKAKVAKQQKEYNAKPATKEKQKQQRDKPENKLKKAKYHQKYDKEHYNKEEAAKYQKEYYDKPENKARITKRAKEYRDKPENKLKRLKKVKEYRTKPESKSRRNKLRREKRHIDIDYKLLCNLRCRLYASLKTNSKSKRTLELLGCSVEELKQHLENQFTKGMSWDNYGDWHIDHIKPCAKFDLSKPEEQLVCFNFKNLQPLWALDNLKKGSFYVSF